MSRAVLPALAIAAGAGGILYWAQLAADGWLAWASAAYGLVLLALAAIDVRYFLLPDALTLPLVPAGLAVAWAIAPENLSHHLAGSLAGFACFAAVREIHYRLRGREGLGGGDVKMMAGLGAFVSWEGLPSVVLIAAAAGLLFALVRGLFGRPLGRDGRLPFGACLALGGWLVWLYGPLTLAGRL